MDIVNIVKCKDYDYDEVINSVKKCLEGLDGIKKIKKGSRVLVKTNLLKKNKPEDAVTTHPYIVEGVVRYLQGMGCNVIIGDSPGGPFNKRILKGIYEASGLMGVQMRTNCELNYDVTTKDVYIENAKYLKQMKIVKVFDEVDYVISCAKLKTHGMMTFTGAVKNLFGVIPGVTKAEYHFKLNDPNHFANMLLDICDYIKPVFSIIDAIECMEGNGPSSGDIRKVGLIMASENPYLLDYWAVNIAGIDYKLVPTITESLKRGLLKESEMAIDVKSYNIAPFKLPNSININFIGGRVPQFVEEFINNSFRPLPIVHNEICISCRICADNCPAKIINMDSGKPIINTKKCIRCFCCHELCPKKAIDIKKHPIHKMIFGNK